MQGTVLQRAQQLAQQQQQPAQQQVFTAPPQWEPFASNGSPPAAAVGRRKSHSFSVSSPDRSGAGPAGWQTFSPLPKPPLPPAARAQAPAAVQAQLKEVSSLAEKAVSYTHLTLPTKA